MIITESSLKLWSAYDSIESYENAYKECGYGFSVTKISPHVLEEQRELNYQYLQSYEFTDDDIKELCTPTIKYLKDAMCGDYSSTVKFLLFSVSIDCNSSNNSFSVMPVVSISKKTVSKREKGIASTETFD